jgi:hypothetical protein
MTIVDGGGEPPLSMVLDVAAATNCPLSPPRCPYARRVGILRPPATIIRQRAPPDNNNDNNNDNGKDSKGEDGRNGPWFVCVFLCVRKDHKK